MNQNVDGLHIHAQSLKHLEGNVKGLQDALAVGYKMDVRVAQLDMLRSLQDFRVRLFRVAVVGLWMEEQKKSWEDQDIAKYQEQLKAADQILDQTQETNVPLFKFWKVAETN